MSEAYAGGRACGAIDDEVGNAAARGAADWLCLAAAPTFAIMALLTGVLGGGPSDLLCSAAQEASPLSGMAPMYLLMSAFHLAPWLKLIAGERSSRQCKAAQPPFGFFSPNSDHRFIVASMSLCSGQTLGGNRAPPSSGSGS